MLDSPHNLHAYEEAGIAYAHVPIGRTTSGRTAPRVYTDAPPRGSTIPGAGADPPRGVRRPRARRPRRLPALRRPGHREDRTPSSSSRRSPVASSVRWRARSWRSRSRRGEARPDRAGGLKKARNRVIGSHQMIAGLRELGVHGVLPEEQAGRSRSRSTSSSPSTSPARRQRRARRHRRLLRAVAEAVSRVVKSERYHLLERLADRIAEVCWSTTASPVVGDRPQAAPAGARDGRSRRGPHRASDRGPTLRRVSRDRLEPRRPPGSCRLAVDGLAAADGVDVVAVSPVYETDPWAARSSPTT